MSKERRGHPTARQEHVAPFVCAIVLVVTPEKFCGQNEHAAIITKVIDESTVHLRVFPPVGQSYPIESVRHVEAAPPGALCWRWSPSPRFEI